MKIRFLIIKEGFLMGRMNKLTPLEPLIIKLSEFNTVEIKKNQISKLYLQPPQIVQK